MAFFPALLRMMGIYRKAWKSLVISQVFVLLAGIFLMLIPAQVSEIINNGIVEGDLNAVLDSALLMILFAFISGIFTMLNLVLAVLFAEGSANFLRTRVYRRVQQFSFKNLDQYPTGELMVRMTNDIYQINQAVQLSMRFLLAAGFQIIVAVILVWLNSPSLVWIFLFVIPAGGLILGGLAYLLQKQYKARQEKTDDLNNILQEDLAGIRVVKSFVREKYESKRFDGVNEAVKAASIRPLRSVALIIPSIFVILGVATAMVIWFGGVEIIDGGTTNVGELIAFSQYFFIILAQLWILSIVLPQITSAEASAARLGELIDIQPDIKDPLSPIPMDPSNIEGRVVFENVSFSYEGINGRESISNINLVAEPGQTVAFLGATGAGKSTLVNLIPRFYDITEGRITIDGIDVRDMSQERLREIVGIALQETVLFSGTVGGNISFGRPEAIYDKVQEAARAADADGFISAIPEGYDARVARRGTNFSGGQKQRMSIARAIAVKPRILIFDDSTSAVDVATETRIQAALDELLKDTTKLVVAQRISTVLNADKIVLLDGGKMVAFGSHAELMTSSPLYREIFESQLGGLRRDDLT
ncbi:MAG TPA: ABC transporter ATP-binding protein [Methanomassiliicoccales archaeon]|nr:ABC transporter ATP-binding protein [Methanomassiliicoccales archaeon]